ncbi:MAG: zinc-dependent metalloprotease [Myxococcota bacterium]|nr:zinc-dependent metalloprotease [Myxococcota bacterium]
MFLSHGIGLFCMLAPIAHADDETEEEETLSQKVDGFDEFDGLFPLYQDPDSGVVHMVIHDDQLDKEYIYFSQTLNGVLEASQFRGSYRANEVLTIRKHFNRIEIVAVNTRYYFNPENPLSRAADANISESILASMEIIADETDADGQTSYLISASDLFLEEKLQQIAPSPNPDYSGNRFSLGGLDGNKTKFHNLRNYDSNTDLIVDYVYHNDKPTKWGSAAVTDAHNVTIRVAHSLIEMPKNNYQPRYDDFRVGYFMHKSDDMTSFDHTPFRDVIHRWNLEPVNPELEVSPPKQPIVWWIENTTPIEFRDAVKEGVLEWNKAFESAGFSNAIEVKVQPDDADWDAGDIDYNVLRWTSSPNPPFGGYGPSFVNPRTGEIIGADIMLELVYITNRVRYDQLLASQSARDEQIPPYLIQPNPHRCAHSQFLMAQMALGQNMLNLQGATDIEKSRLIKEGIKHLVLHEVGHTLGLNHNMKASTNLAFADLHNTAVTDVQGLAGSVMDYTPVNLAMDTNAQGKYFSDIPGAYDHWAIEFGYRPPLEDKEAERARVDALVSRSLEPLLTFGNDADDMRSPYGGIDPRVMIGDLSDNPVLWAKERSAIADNLLENVVNKHKDDHKSFEHFTSDVLMLIGMKTNSARSIANHIGGVYVERGTVDQFKDGKTPFTPVPRKVQTEAMKWLINDFFAAKAFKIDDDVLASLQWQRRGFDHFGTGQMANVNSNILYRQDSVLYSLLHENTLNRMTSTEAYGNQYTVHEMLDDLTEGILFPDILGNTTPLRRELQVMYVGYLSDIAQNSSSAYDSSAQAAAGHQLQKIIRITRPRILTVSGPATRQHRKLIHEMVSSGL